MTALGAEARRDTIGDALRRAARRHRDRPALRYEGRQWTYVTLDQAASRVATALRALGLKPGDRVAAYGKNSDAYLIAWAGITRAGMVHVPANYALTAPELAYIVAQSGSRLVLTDASLDANLSQVKAEGVPAFYGHFEGAGGDIDILAVAQGTGGEDFEEPAVTENDLAQILYTSGTTAAPKGAMLTHRALIAEYMSCIHELDFSIHDKALAALPLYHSAQMHVFTMPQLLVGAGTILLQAPEPATVLRLIEEEEITSFFAPPTVWISLLRHPDFDRRNLTTLKNLYYGASIMPVPVLQELRQRLPGAGAYNCYGQSEISPLATVLRPEEHDERPASAGRPVLNVETRVVDEYMNDVPPGVQGEIIHRSPQLLLGYWDKEKETAESFAGGWFHSGDVGVMDEAGYLYIVDRIKDVIKTGGVLVASREVEEALFTHPAVSEVAVIGLSDPKWVEAVTAVVVLKPGQTVDETALVDHARATLAPFKLPKRIFFADTLPRNTAGKLLKRELRLTYAD
ncbi:fatty acyl-CoA synthetase [Zavarzinia sp. CC-PAN008]|uniref:fatty acyl-CoA synthetase n=1 Tax=Zavarzinia sp. CC-PAN008 TaxID=3243332 RepID=UPI003F74A933